MFSDSINLVENETNAAAVRNPFQLKYNLHSNKGDLAHLRGFNNLWVSWKSPDIVYITPCFFNL